MGLIREAGKKFEETKRSLLGDGQAEYVCRACEEPVESAHEHCPHCGEGPIEPVA